MLIIGIDKTNQRKIIMIVLTLLGVFTGVIGDMAFEAGKDNPQAKNITQAEFVIEQPKGVTDIRENY